jgi:hypothetical protein
MTIKGGGEGVAPQVDFWNASKGTRYSQVCVTHGHNTHTNISAACMEDACVCMCVRASERACVRACVCACLVASLSLSLSLARSLSALTCISQGAQTMDERTRGTPTESDAQTHTRTHAHGEQKKQKKQSPSPGSQSFLTHIPGLQNDAHCTLKEVYASSY